MAKPQKQRKIRSTEHIRQFQWKPGQSGNPGGKPAGTLSLVALARKLLADNPEAARGIVENWIRQAGEGNEKALGFMRALLDRIDGPVPTQVQGPDGGPVEITLRWPDSRFEDAAEEIADEADTEGNGHGEAGAGGEESPGL